MSLPICTPCESLLGKILFGYPRSALSLSFEDCIVATSSRGADTVSSLWRLVVLAPPMLRAKAIAALRFSAQSAFALWRRWMKSAMPCPRSQNEVLNAVVVLDAVDVVDDILVFEESSQFCFHHQSVFGDIMTTHSGERMTFYSNPNVTFTVRLSAIPVVMHRWLKMANPTLHAHSRWLDSLDWYATDRTVAFHARTLTVQAIHV